MSRSTQERRATVLRALVADYVHSGEPVGSKALVEQHDLGVSPATVRNDMSALEEQGYIYQPHTSAGRIPTEKGYRAFVDHIAELKPLSGPERLAIESFLADPADVDDMVDRTVRLLAQLTRQLALVQYPTRSTSKLRHLEIVPLAPTRLLLVVISQSGRVDQRLLDTEQALCDQEACELAGLLNQVLGGRAIGQLQELPPVAPAHRPLVRQIVEAVGQALAGQVHERVVMAGTSHLVRSGVHSIGPILDALEEQVTLLRLFQEMGESQGEGRGQQADVVVSIGSENHHNGLAEAAVVTGAYGDASGNLAHLGVVGPTRMDYPTAMTTVGAVARYLSRFLAR